MEVQKEKIRRVIKREHDLIGSNLVSRERCDNPGHCAVGALLFAAGCSNRYLASVSDGPLNWSPRSKAARVLQTEYGLTRDMASRIAGANDALYDATAKQRRAEVFAAIADLPATA